ncbi:hypothetical protein [Candidatus Palauibacter sp.]|uniref:hypothetical protein n=1 Tax=Candidatus Palauibacter sp. TaxID=3101350 RepID=UPI003CC69138
MLRWPLETALQGGGQLAHTWLQGPSASLNNITLSVMGESYYRNADITPESRSIRPEVEFDFKSGATMTVYSNTQLDMTPRSWTPHHCDV